MRIGDVIRDESPDTDLIFYTVVTRLPDKYGHYEGVQLVIDKAKGELHSASAHTSGNVKFAQNEYLLVPVGSECSVCRRPEYAGHEHEHPCE